MGDVSTGHRAVTERLRPEDLEWESPALSRAGGGRAEQLRQQVAAMRAALTARKGEWAVLDMFDRPTAASAMANQLGKSAKTGDSRLLNIDLAGRKTADGGSKLYVRHRP